MARDASINIRTDSQIKELAESLYASFGITLSDAINMFLNVSVMQGRLPFALEQPKFNKETLEAIEESNAIIEGRVQSKAYHSFEELWNEVIEED